MGGGERRSGRGPHSLSPQPCVASSEGECGESREDGEEEKS